ncbi:MAG: SPFH/Band 7/PHB domain protein [Elusimicrobia bacterium]|nr:SPFH/Band 7/PHB domain protein [Elusimicrobiota bacterium]
MGEFLLLGIAVVVVFVFVFIAGAVNIVRQHEKSLIETLGKYTSTKGPGLVFIVPFFQAIRRVDMREQIIDVPSQVVITKDNVSVNVDALVYFQITEPTKVVYNVANFALAASKLAQTTLRNIVGGLELDTALTSKDRINEQLRLVLDEATDKWGVKVTRVEIKEITPPKDITDAMSKQLKAEREKRASILEAEGLRQSAILKAEGAKQAVILEAEATKEQAILEATGKAEAIKRVAEAEKFKIETVYKAIHEGNPTNDLIAIKYLEALAAVADGQATKIFLPLETVGVTSSIGGIAELFKDVKAQISQPKA